MDLLRCILLGLVVAISSSCDVSYSDADSTDINEVPLPSDRPSFRLSLASPVDERIESSNTWYPNCPDFSFVALNQRGEVSSTTRWGLTTEPPAVPLPSGYSANLYRDGVIQAIGPQDAVHTLANGRQDSQFVGINETGQVAGQSLRFASDGSANGRSAWLNDEGLIGVIGLLDSEHTGADGSAFNVSTILNQGGQVVGSAVRSEEQGGGSSVWFYGDGITHRIGLIDEYHTRSDGYKISRLVGMNDSGQVLGLSNQYLLDPDTGLVIDGLSSWLYSDGETRTIGLLGPLYTSANGTRYSRASQLNSAGEVVGFSSRYDAIGNSHWFYSAGEYDVFLQAEQDFRSVLLNQAGQFVGILTSAVPGSDQWPQSVWLYNRGDMDAIGLDDEEHTGQDGYQRSSVGYPFTPCLPRWDSLNEAGHVIGTSTRFDSSGLELGVSSWLYRDGVTRKIGLIDDAHTRSTDGYRRSRSVQLNNMGQVTGYSARFNSTVSPAEENGYTGWLYDSVKDQLFDLTMSLGLDGYARSSVSWLTESGVALGSYQEFAEDGAELGGRLFYFDTQYGLFDLAELVLRGRKDWDSLLSVVTANEQGQIIVTGTLSNSSNPVYFLLTPVSP